ncbi:UPF0382 membrane protein C1782.12c-like [Pyrus communis]|uniref:UPF0382 membrane protein C1782.12c-like n=1 Tax=Pyrus communis TaxID=23211 RepID=UPI0035C0578F
MYKSHRPHSAWNFETYLLSERGTETEAREATTMDLQLWHKAAALSGIAAVGLGTYGALGFKPKDPTYKEVWLTASLYHLVHTAALLAAPIAKHPPFLEAFWLLEYSHSPGRIILWHYLRIEST